MENKKIIGILIILAVVFINFDHYIMDGRGFDSIKGYFSGEDIIMNETSETNVSTLDVIDNKLSTINISGAIIPINERGAIPLEIQTVQKTDYVQYMGTWILSGIFLVFYLYSAFYIQISEISVKGSLKKIKNKTDRHVLLIKHTQQAMFSGSMIDGKTMLELNKALTKFKGQPFDLILHTPGGEIFSSLLISRIIKNYPAEVRVFIPLYAMSGGTCLALSGKKIYMNDVSCMGPVDPQLGTLFKFGSAKAWEEIVKFKGKRAEDQTVSFAMMGKQYTKTIANHLDFLLKDKLTDAKKRKKFVTFLTDGKVEHAYSLTPTELKKFELETHPIDDEMNKILMKIITAKRYEGLYHE